ncbi:hypothetical protein HOC32_04150 [Candidatus Woesearchaeota archaeon]|jgi:hypothetical protein|nr:hypothetical protein [Candidatus Woesearchaeota archaeon]
MKLTIDTKEDSHEDIRKVMQVLQHMLEGKQTSIQTTEPTPQVDTTNMMNMFGSTPTEQNAEDTAPNFNAFLDLVEKKEEKEDPKIEFF